MNQYRGAASSALMEKLQSLGRNAVGLSGIDGRLLTGKRKNIIVLENGKKKIIRDDYTGIVKEVNVPFLDLLLENGFLPVITPPALSYNNERINVDGDRAAAKIAGSMGADVLIILSNIPGLLRNPQDETSLVREINRD